MMLMVERTAAQKYTFVVVETGAENCIFGTCISTPCVGLDDDQAVLLCCRYVPCRERGRGCAEDEIPDMSSVAKCFEEECSG